MSRRLTELTIFVSGTSDSDAEKAALESVAEELNKMLEKSHSISLRVIGWPTHFRPGVNLDGQSEISRQVGSELDIYVGILGTRFGTPTPRAGSGTEEEFENAFRVFQADSRRIRLLFYFKKSIENIFAIDLVELTKVKSFKDRIGARGILYREFSDTAHFVQMLKEHLHDLIVEEWQADSWQPILTKDNSGSSTNIDHDKEITPSTKPIALPEGPGPSTFDEASTSDEEDLGILDFMNSFTDSSVRQIEILNRINENTRQLGTVVAQRTEEFAPLAKEYEREKNIGGNRAQQQYFSKMQNLINRVAIDLDEYYKTLLPDIQDYRTYSRSVFENFRFLVNADSSLIDGANKAEIKVALETMINGLKQGSEGLGSFQATLSQTPALTGKFKRARQKVSRLLGELIAEFSFSIEEAETIIDEFDNNGADSLLESIPTR